MIDVKKAVDIAVNFVSEMLAGENVHDIKLEETELSEGGGFWYVTLSFRRPGPTLSETLGMTKGRHYKVVQIRRNDGEVMSMKIGQLT